MIEQTSGSRIVAILVNVQTLDTVVAFKGQFSVNVKFPSNVRVNSSYRASFDCVELELMELSTVQILHTT